MGTKKVDKTKLKNWINNDIFAIKITGINKEYYGRYIILIHRFDSIEDFSKRHRYFRVKITKDNKIPTFKEIDKLDFIKTEYEHFKMRYFPLSGGESYENCVRRKSHIKFYPDNYNYLYSYTIKLFFGPKNPTDFIYLGNYELNEPKDEFPQKETGRDFYLYTFMDSYIMDLIECNEEYNLKKSTIYTEEKNKVIEKNAEDSIRIEKEVYEKTKYIIENNLLDEYLKDIKKIKQIKNIIIRKLMLVEISYNQKKKIMKTNNK